MKENEEDLSYREDLRVIRTRKLLSNALIELMEKVPFEKINVKDICEKAMIHRATFYNHFNNKEDLLEYAIDELKEELYLATIKEENFKSEKEMYMSLISNVIDFVQDNKSKILLMLKQNSYDKSISLMLITIKRSIRYLISKNKYHDDYKVPKNIMIDFFTGGLTNIGINWLLSSNPSSKEELLNYFDILLNEEVFFNKN